MVGLTPLNTLSGKFPFQVEEGRAGGSDLAPKSQEEGIIKWGRLGMMAFS
jgi:hypothetical protein